MYLKNFGARKDLAKPLENDANIKFRCFLYSKEHNIYFSIRSKEIIKHEISILD